MKINRRQFLAFSSAFGLSAVFYFQNEKISLHDEKIQTILSLADHLYPQSPLGFGSKDFNFPSYLTFVLSDERILQSDRDYLLRGASWFIEHAHDLKKHSFISLNTRDKEAVIKDAIQYQWGYSYVKYLFSYIFEAMFSAPVYGSHAIEFAWKANAHQAGFPLPQTLKDITYV